MGNRRLSRKRLYQVEKAGIAVDIEAGPGIKSAVTSATQHRQGQEIITEIALDLHGLLVGTDTGDAIGAAASGTNYVYLTELTEAKYGIITEIRAVCVETPAATGGGADIDFLINASGTKENTAAVTGGTAGPSTLTVKGDDAVADLDDFASDVAGKYLYVADGTTGASGSQTHGKFLIYIHGFVAPDDV